MLKDIWNRLKEPEQAEDPERLLAIAAATLLLEVAWADHDIAEAELALIEQQLKREFSLSDAEVSELVAESRDAHDHSVGMYRYTRAINESWDEARKFALVKALWRLALSDDDLDRYEEHAIRKIAELLYLSHSRFIEAKRAVRRDS